MDIKPPNNNGSIGALNHLLIAPNHLPSEPEKKGDYSTCDFPDDEAERQRRRETSDCKCAEHEVTSETFSNCFAPKCLSCRVKKTP